MQEIKRAELDHIDEDGAAISTSNFDRLQSYHEYPSDYFSGSELSGADNNVASLKNELQVFQETPFTLLKQDVLHNKRFNRAKPKPDANNNTHFQPTRKGQANSRTKQSGRRKRIKPCLSVTIPEKKLFPPKKHLKLQPKIRNESFENNKGSKRKEALVNSFQRNKNTSKRSMGLTTCSLQFPTGSLSKIDPPVEGRMIEEDVPDSLQKESTNISHKYDEHFEALQKILENLSKRFNKKDVGQHSKEYCSNKSLSEDKCIPRYSSKCVKDKDLVLKIKCNEDQGKNVKEKKNGGNSHTNNTFSPKYCSTCESSSESSEEYDREPVFLKDNLIPRCYSIGDKDITNNKLVLKFRSMSNNSQVEDNISKENEHLQETDRTKDDNNDKSLISQKTYNLNLLKKTGDCAHNKSRDLMIDILVSKEIQFIDSCYQRLDSAVIIEQDKQREILKLPKVTSLNSFTEESQKDTLVLSNKNSYEDSSYSKDSYHQTTDQLLDKISRVYFHNERDPYEQLCEDFTNYYNSVFDNDTHVLCSEMSDLLENIVTKKAHFLVKEVSTEHGISHRGGFSKTGQDKIKLLNTLFFNMYKKICGVTDNTKQQEILLIAWFVKMKNRISIIANRPWTLKETRINLILIMSQENLELPLVGKVFFMREESFLQSCMMVVDYTLKLKSKDSSQQTGANLPEPHENKKPTAPSKVSEPEPEDNINTNEKTCSISECSDNQPCDSVLNQSKEPSRVVSSCHKLNFCNSGQNTQGEVKKASPFVHALKLICRRKSVEEMEKMVEHIRIGDIDLDHASCRIRKMFKKSGNADEKYLLQKEIDDFINNYN